MLVNGGERSLVVRKLASSLATIFLKPNAPWTRALCNLAASLADGKYVSEEHCKDVDLRNTVLPTLSEGQVTSLLYFSNTLGEEIHKWSSEARRNRDDHPVSENIKDAFVLVDVVLGHILQQVASGAHLSEDSLGDEAINSYQVRSVVFCAPVSSNIWCNRHGCPSEAHFSFVTRYLYRNSLLLRPT